MKSRCNLVVESPLKIANTLCCVGFPPGMMNIGRTLVSTKVEYAAFWKVRPMPLTAIRYAVIPLERKSVFLGWKLYVEHIHWVCRFMRPLTLGQICQPVRINVKRGIGCTIRLSICSHTRVFAAGNKHVLF